MNRLCNWYIVCCILLFALPLSGHAQSSLHWSTTDGDQYLEANGAELHLKPRTDGKGPAVVTAVSHLSLPDTQNWQASFDIRFGVLRDQGSSFHISRGGRDIGRIGADGFTKQMGVFIGKDNEVEASGTDVEWHHVRYVSDGNTLTAFLDGKQVGTGPAQNIPDTVVLSNGQDMGVPCHQEGVWVRNVSVSDGQVLLPAPWPSLAATFTGDAQTIPLRPSDTNVTCQVGDRLQITGSVTMQTTFDSCLLIADGAVAATRTPSIPTDNYSFTWTPETAGTHTLELRYTTLHAKATVRRLLITAADAPPAVLSGLPASVGTDTAVSVVGAGPRPFPLARVDFYFNNKPLSVATAAPFVATLPIEAITQPGTYPVKFITYDGSGRPFYAHASKIEVPQRVQVTAPRTFTLRNAGDKANLTASILPGIKVAKVSYSIVHADASHYETLADVTAAPYSADVDLSNRASGDYWVRAIATSAAGNSYEAWAVQLTLTNMPDDKRVVQEAKDRATQEKKKATEAADAARRQLEAELAAKREENIYEQQVAENTANAVATNRITIELDGNVTKFDNSYLFTLKITNRTNKGVGPINPDLRFDDFSFSIPLPIDTSLTPSINEYGFPSKYLTDMWHDLVVPANSSKTISYFDYNFLASEQSRKPTKITFMGTLRPITIPLTP